MGKPYRFRHLISLLVLTIMFLSGLLTVFSFMLLRGFRILPNAFFATVWMPFVVIFVANAVGAVVNYFIVPRVIKPIEALVDATGKVAKGDFSVRIPADEMVGEVKDLVNSFNAMTQELGNTEIFRSDFIRDFSHEFKTPIVSMKGFARQLKNPDLTPEEREQYCDIIISESERLADMSNNVLLLSRFENQEIVSDKAPYRLDEQLRDCVLILEREWEKKDLELDLELDPITICQNASILHHLWTNLISNAVKFTPEKGTIHLTATENEKTVMVTVRDSGIGMTQEVIKHIFDKCYQADPSHSGKGNGLGLCIAKRVCTLCGGTIQVRSTPGNGSIFTVFLPK